MNLSKMKNWFDIEYLQNGNEKQKQAYNVLKETDIFSILKDYDPILVGTIPIDIDIENSDLDIVCCAADFNEIQRQILDNFSLYRNFSDNMTKDLYIANFRYDGLEIEIFTTHNPSHLQNGYRHMVIEHRILELVGKDFKKEIIRLKREGLKTEPAFGKLLDMKEPYSELLELEKLNDQELNSFIQEHYILFSD